MAGVPRQRARYGEAMQLSQESSQALQPLHDDLAALSPSFDGIVYFAKDQWHPNNASAVATVQPESGDTDRFQFYKENIERHRVDLGATALGEGLKLASPQFLRSRMNPAHHTTWVHGAIIDGEQVGGLQGAFNSTYGEVPSSTRGIESIFKKHEPTVLEVANAFKQFETTVQSTGDVLELSAPTTPNAFIISWDVLGSTQLAKHHYGALRNYLLDMKGTYNGELHSSDFESFVHDTGDGQDITVWLPETSASFDRADIKSLHLFGKAAILPLIRYMLMDEKDIFEDYKQDIRPRTNISVDLGYVERDKHDERTSQTYWVNGSALKAHPAQKISFTPKALNTLLPD